MQRLDWLARFDVQPQSPHDTGSGFVVVGRDGKPATGLHALSAVARCTPLLFPLWIPTALVAALRRSP